VAISGQRTFSDEFGKKNLPRLSRIADKDNGDVGLNGFGIAGKNQGAYCLKTSIIPRQR
jgi:hypothetical protein